MIANVDNIYGYGIGSQKFFVNNKKILHKNILRLNYPNQTKEFLTLNGVKLNDLSINKVKTLIDQHKLAVNNRNFEALKEFSDDYLHIRFIEKEKNP